MPEIEIRLPDGSTTWVPYEPMQQEPTAGQSFVQGVLDTPRNFLSSLGGLKPAAGIVGNLLGGDREEGLRGVADVAGGIAGGGYGAMAGGALGALGGPFAPVTVPLGATLGGLLGGTLGSVGTDYAVQAIRGEPTPTMNDAAYALGGGVPFAALGNLVAGANKASGSKSGYTLADKLEGKAIGARTTDYAKSVRQRGLGDEGQIALADAIKRVGKTGIYKETLGDPIALKLALESQMDDLAKLTGSEVQRLEQLRQQQGATIGPDWKRTTAAVDSLKGSGAFDDMQTKALNRINAIEGEVDLGTLPGLDQARKALNKSVYGQTDPAYVNELSDSLRSDVRAAEMAAANMLDPNNTLASNLSNYGDRAEIVQKILNRQIGSDMVNTPNPRGWWRTSGGFGVPTAIGIASGNPFLTAGAVGVDALFNTTAGRLMLADILRNQGTFGIPGAVQRGFVPMQQYDQFGE